MKRIYFICCVLALLVGALILPAQAVTPKRVTVRFHDETAMSYGEESTAEVVNIVLNDSPMVLDVPAISHSADGQDSRTLIPVRPIAEALGATVLWEGESRQVVLSAGDDRMVLTLGSATAVVNGESVTLPGAVPAQVVWYDGAERTMVPLRFVSERLHAQVDWDNDNYAARITAAQPVSATETAPEPVINGGNAALAGLLLRITPDDNANTVTLYLSAEPRYVVTDLGNRVAIDLPGFAIGSGKDGSIQLENPAIASIRYAQHTDDLYPGESCTTRVVFDLLPGCTYGENITVFGDGNLRAVVVTVNSSGNATDGGAESTASQGNQSSEISPGQAATFTVALDAGHGGKASGAAYEEYLEKDITLPITLRAAQLLREKGYHVVLTRSDDVYMDLYDRCRIANAAGCDVFVSIHCNASATNRFFQGTFTYHYPDSVEGAELARAVQAAVVAETGSIDRGLLSNNYVVLRETWMPACLLETGFMSTHEELMKLITPAYQEKLAQGVAKGVERYLSTLPVKTVEPPPAPAAVPVSEVPGTLESPLAVAQAEVSLTLFCA